MSAPSEPALECLKRSTAELECLRYLRRKDDTSRFFGLTMLLPLLKQIEQDRGKQLMEDCTTALDGRFIDRLLHSSRTKPSDPKACAMVELAVYFMEALITTAPLNSTVQTFVLGRVPALVNCLSAYSKDVQDTVLRILDTVSMDKPGAEAILEQPNLTMIILAVGENSHALQAAQQALTARGIPLQGKGLLHLREAVDAIGDKFADADLKSRMKILHTLERLVHNMAPIAPLSDPWVGRSLDTIQSVLMASSNRSTDERAACVSIISELLLYLPPESILGSVRGDWNKTRQDFGYHLIKFLTIDLTAAFSQLHAALDSSDYAGLAERHAANFDFLSKFLMYLLECEDIEAIGMEPQHILKLREDMDTTFKLAIEFLRDRWDATTSSNGEDAPKLACGAPQDDVLVCAVMRALSIWLGEDGSLCSEAVDLMDVFLGLWPTVHRSTLDFRPWIIGVLHSILDHPGAMDHFVSLRGTQTICDDLLQIYRNGPTDDGEILKGVDEARLLLSLIDQETPLSRTLRKEVLQTLIANYKKYRASPLGLGLSVLLLQVAKHCITNGGERKSCKEVAVELRRWIDDHVQKVGDWVRTDLDKIMDD